jgi:uncharacterized Zn finger protein
MGRNRLQILTYCEVCGGSAGLKTINDYPFSKGFSEATYECNDCGQVTTLALSEGKRDQQEVHFK